jgi:DNA polymerase III subunit beta
MKFQIARDHLLKTLMLVAGVVERRQTLPILGNILLDLSDDALTLVGTDLEVELQGRVAVEPGSTPGRITVPARKFVDICRSLPDGSQLQLESDEGKVQIKSGRSRFSLATLPASEFPNIEEATQGHTVRIAQSQLRRLIDRTGFAMAQQDVRFYLNGMLMELTSEHLRAVATDGHRLAMCTMPLETAVSESVQVIVPRKGILEFARLLGDELEEPVAVVIGSNHIQATIGSFTFTSKLVDGKFPDYQRVLPRNPSKDVLGARQDLRQAFSRVAILSNEKYRGVRLLLSDGSLRVLANNPEQEEAEESLNVEYSGESLEIGFNVNYLLDVLNVVQGEQVKLSLSDAGSSALLQEAGADDSLYVVMPMRL